MNVIQDLLPSGKKFRLDLNLNHPTLLPGVQVMAESVLYQGGKLFRPRLCFMVAEAIGLSLDKVSPFARIAEMVHGATLAHDDVIDEATERRNKVTLNAKITQARAVLAGDLMLARAMVELCDLGHGFILKRMSEVLEDLVTGEWLQLENRGNLSITLTSLDTIAGYKTASILEWCAEIPLHVQGVPIEAIPYAQRFGYSLGLAFQYIDDCHDFSLKSGKGFSRDLSEGLLNQVTFILISKKPKLSNYFTAIMNDEIKVDQASFISEVEESCLAFALSEVRKKAAHQIRVADESLSKLALYLDRKSEFRYLRRLLDQLLKQEF